jgi:hypothetical protein
MADGCVEVLPHRLLTSSRHATALRGTQLSTAQPEIDVKLVTSDVASSPAKKPRRRGFGSSWVEKSAQPAGKPSATSTSEAKRSKSQGRGDSSEDGKDKEELRDAISALHPPGGSRPSGSRLRSRAAKSSYILPNGGRALKSKTSDPQKSTEEELALQALLRKSILTREVARRGAAFLNVNPGANHPVGRGRKIGAEDMGVVPLSELKRRGLISLNMPSQSVLAGDNDIIKELRVDMAVFVLEVCLC